MSLHTRRDFLIKSIALAASSSLAPLMGSRAFAYAAMPSTATLGKYAITDRLDMAMVKRHGNFGYKDDEIAKYFDYEQVFEYDATGLAAGRIKSPPPAGVHPRILFTADDLPELRNRLASTKPGQLQMVQIRAMLDRDLTGPKARFGALYEAAAQGTKDPALLNVEACCPIIYECFRCLLDNDPVGGKKAAAALTTLAQQDSDELDKEFALEDSEPNPKSVIQLPMRDFQKSKSMTQHGVLACGYDFAYQWMTDDQRKIVRATLAKASSNMTLLCAEGLPALPANTSNWIPMHMRLVLLCCAIEGEPGYDPGTYHRCVEGYKRYLNVGMFDAGDAYESMGKNFLIVDNLVAIGNRGNNLAALKKVRTQVGNYYLHAMDPWGGHFTFYDSLGGRGNTTPMLDAQVMKYLFPDDPGIDVVYRNTVGEEYAPFRQQIRFGHPLYLLEPLMQAIFAVEYDPKTWDESMTDATNGRELTFFSNGTGNMITRNAWDKNTIQFHFLTRSVSGGHQYADRGHFSIHALGRYWAIYKPLRQVDEHYLPKNRSVLLIDGEGPGTVMARCAAFQDQPQATFIAADLKTAYDWASGTNDRFPAGGKRVEFTANDFRLEKSPLPWMNLAWSDMPFWSSSMKGAENWIPRSPVEKAFRTGGLVRGPHPYVLIVDDVKKDDKPHAYQWGMTLEDDLVVVPSNGDANDIVLGESAPTAKVLRFMLVRVLDANGLDAATPPSIEEYELPNPPQKNITMHRLTLNAQTVAPDFKTLLFPFEDGDEMPKTMWNTDKTQLTVAWSDQRDLVSFIKGADGRTQVSIRRNGADIVKC